MKFLSSIIIIILFTISSFSQELPIHNGELEQISNSGFTSWSNQSIHGSNAIFDVVDNLDVTDRSDGGFGST